MLLSDGDRYLCLGLWFLATASPSAFAVSRPGFVGLTKSGGGIPCLTVVPRSVCQALAELVVPVGSMGKKQPPPISAGRRCLLLLFSVGQISPTPTQTCLFCASGKSNELKGLIGVVTGNLKMEEHIRTLARNMGAKVWILVS